MIISSFYIECLKKESKQILKSEMYFNMLVHLQGFLQDFTFFLGGGGVEGLWRGVA